MSQVSEIIKSKIAQRGGNKSEIARQLGVSSQLLGQYERGRHKPKPEFYIKWKEVFGEDLLSKTNVSKEANEIVVDASLFVQMAADANEARIKELKEHNLFLQRLLEANLGKLDRIEQLSAVSLAQLKGALKYQAEKEAKGDKKQQEKIESHVSKLAGEALKTILPTGSGLIPHT